MEMYIWKALFNVYEYTNGCVNEWMNGFYGWHATVSRHLRESEAGHEGRRKCFIWVITLERSRSLSTVLKSFRSTIYLGVCLCLKKILFTAFT